MASVTANIKSNITECSYKKCSRKEDKLSNTTARVEIKSYVPEKVKKDQLFIVWDEDGEARFHMKCWDEVVKDSKVPIPECEFTLEEKEMVKEARKTAEYFNSYSEIQQEAKRISKMILSAKHATVFTGAGISTSAGIGDFRGKGGKWTERDRAKKYGQSSVKTIPKKTTGGRSGYSHRALRPTYTHEALVKMVQMGLIKYMISQNTDGLHRLSGIPRDKISELHGNTTHERCELCTARYERTFAVGSRATNVPANPCKNCRINHRTGRMCERKGCNGHLMNTIINFGDNLESDVLDRAVDHAERKDLIICLGSTLSVTPASDLVMYGKQPVQVVICNRQPTQYDDQCNVPGPNKSEALGSRVYGDCDTLMKEVMACLLPQDELQEWEDDRDQRMVEYDKQRIPEK